MHDLNGLKIAIIGLGYVGLPLAIEFGKNHSVVGFDVNVKRISDLAAGVDATLEVSDEELKSARNLLFTADLQQIRQCNFYIVTVPTPIDSSNQPDLSSLKSASEMLSKVIAENDVVVYESTVYPGTTEEICVPILEAGSGLIYNSDLFIGYSPERVNPGDKIHRVSTIKKVTSGSNRDTAGYVDQVYNLVITAGTHLASSIKVAEASKVIENTQRDVNIALINELAIIFNKLEIDTLEVLEAAGSKWNFLPFRPGLVGGHCISVDPYYLAHKAQSVGYHPAMILAGRRLNDGMGQYVASQLVKAMLKKRIQVLGAKVLIMGFAFKENCPDLRNTKVIDIVRELVDYGAEVEVCDPWCSNVESQQVYGLPLIEPKLAKYDAIVIAVAHKEYFQIGAGFIHGLGKPNHVLYDLKYVLAKEEVDIRL
ncbi:MAG: Vi polysaccharide biosynthesis UDP-N-acetylglucosamine C-6 dehydrogenase TviB [Oceanospirillaceae bacterium]|nr:Vi polysaccharide biosynthesis UDP-N-acetylglucosamine C-6 dehydrogenase TviB [Oceanospirillaceae bacterium]